ncbi:MAG: PAS domain S-box protein [Gemmatimonadota bacterium]|nr:PAS domain S-box protein [Gemmatimonadota bacterium]
MKHATGGVALTAGLGLFIYEATKSAIFPHLTLWQSHGMTILFGSIVATLAAYHVLREQARLHSTVLQETADRIRAESAQLTMSTSEARYRGLIESLPAAIAVHRGGQVVYGNPACMALMELDPSALAPLGSLLDFIDVDDRERALKRLAVAADEHDMGNPEEYRLYTARGNMIVVEAMSAAITHDGKRAIQTLLRDITERSAAQAALEAARNAAEAASLAKSEFLANMSHELRTPLNSVIGFSNILRRNTRQALTPKEVGYIERIQDNGRHLLSLIDGVLDLTKVETGHTESVTSAMALADVVFETVAELESQLLQCNRKTIVDMHESAWVFETDRAKFKQILLTCWPMR